MYNTKRNILGIPHSRLHVEKKRAESGKESKAKRNGNSCPWMVSWQPWLDVFLRGTAARTPKI